MPAQKAGASLALKRARYQTYRRGGAEMPAGARIALRELSTKAARFSLYIMHQREGRASVAKRRK